MTQIESRPILLLEPDLAWQEILLRRFCDSGFSAQGFSRGRDVLAAAAQEGFPLLLLELNLPDIDWQELVRRLRGNEFCTHTTFIALTHLAHPAVSKRCLELAFSDYLIKSEVTMPQIIASVATHLKQQTIY